METVLRSLNQWEVVIGTFVPPMCADPNSPTKAELQLEKAWKLRKERAYMGGYSESSDICTCRLFCLYFIVHVDICCMCDSL